eukprot:scaffold96357_cov43-Prasinocladus_malaysianus.AAC.1
MVRWTFRKPNIVKTTVKEPCTDSICPRLVATRDTSNVEWVFWSRSRLQFCHEAQQCLNANALGSRQGTGGTPGSMRRAR